MSQRWVLWLFPLVVLGGVCAMAFSVLAFHPADAQVTIAADRLEQVTRQPISPGVRVESGDGRPLHAFWFVRDGSNWRAFADRDTHVRGCPLEWRDDGSGFIDRCGGSVWDRVGRLVGGPGDRNLDEFTVSDGRDGYVTVDLSQLKQGAPSPLQVFRAYVYRLQSQRGEDAWLLIHPDRRTPEAFQRFVQAVQKSPRLRTYQVEGQGPVTMWDDQLEQAGVSGGRTWAYAVQLTIRWDSGGKQEIHLAPDDAGNWRLIWSPTFALE